MKKMLAGLTGLIVIGLFVVFFANYRGQVNNVVRLGSATIAVDLANTPASREQGLSGRKSLKDGEGMLFVLDEPGRPGFWMKDMNFPLDIIWIDSQKRVVDVLKDISPETYPEVFWPSKAVKYVLEVPAGYAQRHGVDTGSELFLEF